MSAQGLSEEYKHQLVNIDRSAIGIDKLSPIQWDTVHLILVIVREYKSITNNYYIMCFRPKTCHHVLNWFPKWSKFIKAEVRTYHLGKGTTEVTNNLEIVIVYYPNFHSSCRYKLA